MISVVVVVVSMLVQVFVVLSIHYHDVQRLGYYHDVRPDHYHDVQHCEVVHWCL